MRKRCTCPPGSTSTAKLARSVGLVAYAAGMSRVTSIGGVFLRSRDPERLRSFYQSVLGFDLGSWGGATFPIHEGDRAGYQIWGAVSQSSTFLGGGERDVMVTLRVTDLESSLARARSHGADVLPRRVQRVQGKYAYLRDPDGTLLELWEPNPQDPQLRTASDEIDLRDPVARGLPAPRSVPRSSPRQLPDSPGTTSVAVVTAPAPVAAPTKSRAAVPVSLAALRTSGAEVGTLMQATTVPITSEQAWHAWTNPKLLASWWGACAARVDLRIGGRYEIDFISDAPEGNRGSEGSQILSYVPGRLLSFSWNAPPHMEMRGILTWVCVDFQPRDEGCVVEVQHSGFGTGPHWATYQAYLQGAWRRALHRFTRAAPTLRSY